MPRKLNSEDLEKYRGVLLRLRDVIRGDIQNLESDAFDTDGERASADSPADAGTDSFSQEFNLELLARDEDTLGAIVAALKRLETHSFGKCEACGAGIPKMRLNAMPFASNCIDCQRSVEQA